MKRIECPECDCGETWYDAGPGHRTIHARCETCDGTGDVFECDKCDGRGTWNETDIDGTYLAECEACEGRGWVAQ